MQERRLFPRHSTGLSHCLENELRVPKLSVLLHFSSLGSVFVKQAPNSCSSQFLAAGWYSSVAQSSMHMSQRIISYPEHRTELRHSWNQPSHTCPSNNSSGSLSEAFAEGGASTRINLIAGVALQNHSQGGEKKNVKIRRRRARRVG